MTVYIPTNLLRMEKDDDNDQEFLDVMQQLQMNIEEAAILLDFLENGGLNE